MRTKKNGRSDEVALITGASGGIGYELAFCFAKDGYDLVLVARREKELQKLAGEIREKYSVRVTVIAKDLAAPSAPGEIFSELRQAGVKVDILVNNAAFGTYGFFVRNDVARELEQIRLNVSALTHLTALFAAGMVSRKKGKILNVASTAAFQPGPLMAVYYASKAYVLSFSEALSSELKGSGVTVTCLCPGPTRTGFDKVAALEKLKVPKANVMSAAKVAEIGYRALMKGRTVVIAGFGNKLVALGAKLAPRSWSTAVSRMILETAGISKLQ